MPRSQTEKARDRLNLPLFLVGLFAFGGLLIAFGIKGFFEFSQQPQAMAYDEFVRKGATSDRVVLSDFHIDPRLAVKGHWEERHHGPRPRTEYYNGYFQPLLRSEDDAGPVRAFVLIESSRNSLGQREPEFQVPGMGYDGAVKFGSRIRGKVGFSSTRDQVAQTFNARVRLANGGKPIELSSGFVLLSTEDAGPGWGLFFGILWSVLGLIVVGVGVFFVWLHVRMRLDGVA